MGSRCSRLHARFDFSLDFAHAAAAGRALDRARLSTRLARSGGRGRGGLFFCPPEERRSRCGTAAAVLSGACLGAFCRRTRSGGGADPPGLHGAGGEVGDGGDARRRRRRASQLPRAAIRSAATVIRAPWRDRTSALVISSLFARAQVGLCAGIGAGVSGREGRRGRGGRRPRQPAIRNVLLPWLARMEMVDERHQRPLDRVRVVAVATPSPSPCLSRRSRSSKRSRHRRRLRGRRAK